MVEWLWPQHKIDSARSVHVHGLLHVDLIETNRVLATVVGLVDELPVSKPVIRERVDRTVLQVQHRLELLRRDAILRSIGWRILLSGRGIFLRRQDRFSL